MQIWHTQQRRTAAMVSCEAVLSQLSSSNIRVHAIPPDPTITGIFATSRLAEEGLECKLEKTAKEIRNESARIYQLFGLGGGQTYYYNRSAAPE